MWDNYLSELRDEYWDCGESDSLSFLEGETPFHFRPEYYKQVQRALKCT